MSRRPRGPRPGIVAATLLTAALALAGCSAGAVTQTDTIVSQADGARGQVGPVSMEDVSIEPGPAGAVPPGAEATIRGSIINDGPTTDRLVAVSTPYAQNVRPEGALVIPANNAVRLVGDEPGPVGPADAALGLGATARLTLTGVTQQLRQGPTYPVTFTFERAGTVTVPVIVSGLGPPAG
ncbi:copper chaperone PCu(A)C [Actinomycetospora rhizophila]|uniref:Copper chaperone PCu(A)C n=1 Tax=Actinomycetospora rhizophila TaxID=1416876 RepID=A0ABV9Z999_9PSEU